jgi:pentatricopeptide repeat protein
LVQTVRNDPLFATEVNAIVYCSILKGFSHKKAFDRVWMLYQEMMEHKVTFSIVTYNALVDACARCQQMTHVPGILEDMLKLGLQPNLITYSTIAKGYCQENKFDQALEVVNNMKATTAFRPDEVLYNSLLDGCARKGLYDRGMTLFAEMQEEGVRPSNFTLSVLVKLSSRGKGLEATFTLVEQLKAQFGLRPNTFVYSNLVHACVTHKDFHRAVQVLDQMLRERVKPDTRIYTLLIENSLKCGNYLLTIDLLRASLGLSEAQSRWASSGRTSQPQGGIPAHLVTSTVECLVHRGDQEQRVASLLQDLRRSGHKIDHKVSLRVAGSKAQPPHRRGAGRS